MVSQLTEKYFHCEVTKLLVNLHTQSFLTGKATIDPKNVSIDGAMQWWPLISADPTTAENSPQSSPQHTSRRPSQTQGKPRLILT